MKLSKTMKILEHTVKLYAWKKKDLIEKGSQNGLVIKDNIIEDFTCN